MSYKYLLFDLDGTLTDPQEGITNCVKHGLKAMGMTETDEQVLRSFIGPPLEESFKRLYNFTDEETKFVIRTYRERYSTIGLFENRLLDGVKEMFEVLQREKPDVKIALATSKPKDFAVQIIEKYGILPYFDILDGCNLDGTKIHKHEVIASILDQLNLTTENASEILMIGDRKHDVEGSAIFGIDCIGVRCGYAAEGELEAAGAKYIVDTIEDLRDFLLTH